MIASTKVNLKILYRVKTVLSSFKRMLYNIIYRKKLKNIEL